MVSSLNLAEIAADQFVQTGVLALVGALLTHVLLRHYPTRRLVVQITFFVALTVLLLHYGIIPYELAPADKPVFERVFVALSKIIWWTNAAWVLIACVRVFLIFERLPRRGRLIQDRPGARPWSRVPIRPPPAREWRGPTRQRSPVSLGRSVSVAGPRAALAARRLRR